MLIVFTNEVGRALALPGDVNAAPPIGAEVEIDGKPYVVAAAPLGHIGKNHSILHSVELRPASVRHGLPGNPQPLPEPRREHQRTSGKIEWIGAIAR